MIEARFSIVTPLFMGGADPKVPELRVPGIKGALRFWWRALAWSWYNGDLSRIRDLEGQIFGSTKDGQSRVIMDLWGANANPTNTPFFKSRQGLMYLGYGLIDRNRLTRDYLEHPVDATLRIHIRPQRGNVKAPDESEITDQISKALIAMGLFGGLGARSRRGFGSFNLIKLDVDGENKFVSPMNKDQLVKEIQKFLKDLNLYNIALERRLPEYTAFSPKTEIYIFKYILSNPLDLLDKVGGAMRDYRLGSMGRWGRKTSMTSSKFKNDTDIAKNALRRTADKHPQRLFFGLPHNYHFKGSDNNLEIRGENHDRRASPLLIHVQKLGTEYAAVAALMPAMFLPDGEKILMKAMKVGGGAGAQKTGDPMSLPESLVELDAKEAAELGVIRNFLESWERVIE